MRTASAGPRRRGQGDTREAGLGNFEAHGSTMLGIRLHEVAALQELSELFGSEVSLE